MTGKAMLLIGGMALAAAAAQDRPPRVEIKNTPQKFELLLPDGYSKVSPAGIPEPIFRAWQYRYQWKGQEDWEVLRLSIEGGVDPKKALPLTDPDTLFGHTYDKVRKDQPPERIQSTEGTEKIGPFAVETVTVRFDQDMPFLVLGARIKTSPLPIHFLLGGPSTLEPQIREHFKQILSEIRIPSDYLTPDEIQRVSDWGVRSGAAALIVSILYFLFWLAVFRRDADSAYGVRVAWMGVAAVLWIADVVLGLQAVPSIRALDLPTPFLMRLELTIPLSLAFAILTFVKIMKPRSAWAWA